MFSRSVLDQLQLWKDRQNRKPLILRGARQVGKTSVIRMFGEDYDEYLEFNLEKKSDAELFSHQISISDLLQLLLITKGKTGKGKVLIFIDEIQNSAAAVAQLRYFYEEVPHIHVIAAGSLLEIMMDRESISFPVGRVEFLRLYPLTFQEYLLATNKSQLLEQLRKGPLASPLHDLMLENFYKYVLIGGMPEIVQNYSIEKDIPSLNAIYNGLLTTYQDDIGKYASSVSMERVLKHCLEMAPFEAGKRFKFAGFGESNYKSKEVSEALKILERIMVVQLIHPSTSLNIPIVPDYKKSAKLQFLDTGLINYIAGLQQHFFQQSDIHSIYRGLIAEHIVTQEIIAYRENSLHKVCFWVREKGTSNAEVDLLIQKDALLIPVEVKSGAAGRLRSLHSFIDLSHSRVAVRISSAPFSSESCVTIRGNKFTLLNIPLYHCSHLDVFLDREYLSL